MKRRMREIYVKSSDPFERGHQHGAQVKGEIERVCVGYRKSFEKKDTPGKKHRQWPWNMFHI